MTKTSSHLARTTMLAVTAVLLPMMSVCDAQRNERIAPTYRNVSYGTHERNVLDFWQAKSDQPTPLAVHIHGGGFRGGKKESVWDGQVRDLLKAGISVATVEYRLVPRVPLNVCFEDVRRAVQFLRSKSAAWNIDKTRVAAWGGSAGAQLAMCLGFHDDMANPDSDDPVERESTRLTCVGSLAGQVTMDFDWWQKHVPGYKPRENFHEYFGVQSPEAYAKIVKDVAALELISEDDPPIFMSYRMAPGQPFPDDPKTAGNWRIHHVIHGIKLKEKADALGVENHLKYPGARLKHKSMTEFLKTHLIKGASRAERNSD